MSKIVLGVGASHSTLMNTHWDEVAGVDRALAFREGLCTAAARVARCRPDVVVVVGSNHFRGFWLDLMPQFTVGVRDCISSGEARTPSGPVAVDADLALEICRSVVGEDFDAAFSVRLQIDHGISHAFQYVLAEVEVPIVPIVVNVFAPPLTTLARCDAFGAAVGRGIRGDGADKRVAIVASGGLSHRLPFPNWSAPKSDDDAFLVDAWTEGRSDWERYDAKRREITRATTPVIEVDFDHGVLRLLEDGRLDDLSALSNAQLEAEGGNGANELRSWLVMAAACGHHRAETIAYSPMPEWLTGMAISVIETEETTT